MIAARVIIVIATLISHTLCAPKVKGSAGINSSTISSPANLSYKELSYIIRVRNGIETPDVNPIYLTPCARAILGCCKDSFMDSECSESLKCGAFFFDDNPCDTKFILNALESAKEFYEQFNNVSKE